MKFGSLLEGIFSNSRWESQKTNATCLSIVDNVNSDEAIDTTIYQKNPNPLSGSLELLVKAHYKQCIKGIH